MAAQLVELIRQLWPDLHITITHIQQPTSEMVCSFYQRFCDELDEKMECLCNERLFKPLPDNINSIMGLYCKLYIIYQHYLKFDQITLRDLYQPTTKRTIRLFQIATHLMGYINNNVHHLLTITSQTLNKVTEFESLKREFNDLKMVNSELLEKLGKVRERSDILTIKLNMLKELKCVKQNEAELLKLMVNEQDYQQLKEIKYKLEENIRDLDEKDQQINASLVEKKESVDNFNEIMHQLVQLNFQQLPFKQWSNHSEELSILQQHTDEQIVENRTLIELKTNKQQHLDDLFKKFDAEMEQLTAQIKKSRLELKQLEEDYNLLSKEAEIKEALISQITNVRHDINDLMAKKEELKNRCERYLQVLASKRRNAAENFEQKLKDVLDKLDNIYSSLKSYSVVQKDNKPFSSSTIVNSSKHFDEQLKHQNFDLQAVPIKLTYN